MTSEFSTQKTHAKDKRNFAASQKTSTDDNKKETPISKHLYEINGGPNGEGQNGPPQSPSVQILNSEPIRRFNLPDSDSERSPLFDRQRLGGANFNLKMQRILPEDG